VPQPLHASPRRSCIPASVADKPEGERINRYLARCGIASRRKADALIREGRVTIDGKPATLGARVFPESVVCVDGQRVQPVRAHLHLLYNKPAGEVVARSDPQGRRTIFDRIEVPANVQPVGRLDVATEGLLLLTSDGELLQRLIRPQTGIVREYRARVRGHLDEDALLALRRGGIPIGRGEQSAPWDVVVERELSSNSWLRIRLARGRWREVRRTLAAIGHPVLRLIRVRFGPIVLDPVRDPPGSFRPLKKSEIKRLYRAAGLE